MDINEKKYFIEETDESLIHLYREGAEQVLDLILEKYKSMVKREAKKLFIQGGDNDDLIQEGMIGLMKAINDYEIDNTASFRTFAQLCISRQMYTAVEAASRKKHMPLNSYVSINASDKDGEYDEIGVSVVSKNENINPEKLFLGQEYEKAFTQLLMSRLSTLEKEVLLLHITGMDYTEIAMQKGKEPKAIDNALQRIKSKAKQVLKEC